MKIYRIESLCFEYMRYSYDSQLTSKYSDPLQLHGTSKIRIHTHAVRGGSGRRWKKIIPNIPGHFHIFIFSSQNRNLPSEKIKITISEERRRKQHFMKSTTKTLLDDFSVELKTVALSGRQMLAAAGRPTQPPAPFYPIF